MSIYPSGFRLWQIPAVPYRQLDEANILRTLERLKARIGGRFPGSGLSTVADEPIFVGKEVVGGKEVSETVVYLREIESHD